MSGKLEYLEKYSVAPSPSRDYYGLRVFDDQVTLYLWRISHGPHKIPIVRTSGFADFKQDLRLQDEIQRIFGEYWLKHVQNITSGSNTLLTLPRSLIKRLIKYLTVKDIVKLSTLSHISNEIFNENYVWQTLYEKCKPSVRNRREILNIESCNWKELFQLAQMQGLSNEQKMLRTRPTTKQSKLNPKLESSIKANVNIENLVRPDPKVENPTKGYVSVPKVPAKVIPLEIQQSKRLAEASRKRAVQNPIPRKLPDNRQSMEFASERDKVSMEKKALGVKSLQMSGQRNVKVSKDQPTAPKVYSKREIESKNLTNNKITDVRANRIQNKVKSVDAKSSNASIKTLDEKVSNVKLRNLTTAKLSKTDKAAPRSGQVDQTKSKTKGKTRKIGQSKSTILNTSTALLNAHTAVKDDSFDLADLIEASLKNIRSPRSIFDYSFSCLDKPKSCGGDTKAQEIGRKLADHPRALKSAQIKATLDRLSEKSEPLTAKSIDSVNKSEESRGVGLAKGVEISNVESKRPTELDKNSYKIPMHQDKVDYFDRYGVYNKYPTPRVQSNTEQKKSTPKKEVDKMSVLRSLGSKITHGRGINSAANSEVNRAEVRKTIDNFYKYL